jgi:hypothetical protein
LGGCVVRGALVEDLLIRNLGRTARFAASPVSPTLLLVLVRAPLGGAHVPPRRPLGSRGGVEGKGWSVGGTGGPPPSGTHTPTRAGAVRDISRSVVRKRKSGIGGVLFSALVTSYQLPRIPPGYPQESPRIPPGSSSHHIHNALCTYAVIHSHYRCLYVRIHSIACGNMRLCVFLTQVGFIRATLAASWSTPCVLLLRQMFVCTYLGSLSRTSNRLMVVHRQT